MKSEFLKFVFVPFFVACTSQVWAFDESRPVDIQQSFLKTEILQDGKKLSNQDFFPALDTLPEAEDIIESSETAWDIGYGFVLAGPMALLYGATANASNPQTGLNFMLGGALGTAGGLYLINLSAKWRARAGSIYNEDRTTEKPHYRMYLVPFLAFQDAAGLRVGLTF